MFMHQSGGGSQHPESDRLQDRLRDMVKAIVAAVAVTGDLDKVIYRFCNEPITDYRHTTAAELVAEGRLDAVRHTSRIYATGLPVEADPARPECYLHRFHSPDWAHLPASGAGAAVNGGRFNRPDVEALYLSAESDTALAEYQQGTTIAPPATWVAYRLDVHDDVDL